MVLGDSSLTIKNIKLLEEIRDLQRQHIDNYKTALQNQQQSIEMQRKAIARQKVIAVARFAIDRVRLDRCFLGDWTYGSDGLPTGRFGNFVIPVVRA